MSFSPLLNQLIDALRCLPSVGPKSAQRMAFYLLQHGRDAGLRLAKALEEAIQKMQRCKRCYTLSETELCHLCNDIYRDTSLLCVVETPADMMVIEQTGSYRGCYFVLMGRLSPLDGIGPKELGIDRFVQCVDENSPKEIILATNSTVEGEATAHYLAELVKPLDIKVTRIAHGVPLGGELEFVDAGTLTRALSARIPVF